MDDFLSRRREIFFNNLVLLGLDRLTFEKKYGIPFHKDMFLLPNKKGYEVVTYFLFSKLSAVTGKDYNIPWPLLDIHYERQFQKTCYAHLMAFSQENLVKFPRIVPSLLSTFGTERLYAVYLAFSNYVLATTIKKTSKDFLSYPSLSEENFSCARDILQLSTVRNMQNFRNTLSLTNNSHRIWTRILKNFEEYLKKLDALLKLGEGKNKEMKLTVSSLYSLNFEENLSLKKIIQKCLEYGKLIIKKRKTLDLFFSADTKFWQHLASEVEIAENNFLDGQIYDICIRDDLPKMFCEVLEKAHFFSSKEEGKLSVLRFMKIFMTYLTCIAKLLKKEDFNQLYKEHFMKDLLHTQEDLLSSAEKLNQKFDKGLLPAVDESIKELKLIVGFDATPVQAEMPCNQFCGFLPVKSFNPVDVKQRTSHFNPTIDAFHLPSLSTNVGNPQNEMIVDVFSIERPSILSQSVLTSGINLFDNTTYAGTMSDGKASFSSIMMEKESLKAMPPEYSSQSSKKISISDLDDIDFASSSHFKMRPSWLKEESLDSMSLPDLSFGD